MVEEMRFFLRIGLYTLVISIVYWFASYDIVGTFLLAFVAIGVALFMLSIAREVRVRRADPIPSEGSLVRRAVSTADRVIGFNEHHDLGDAGALEVEEEPLPHSSIWPPVAAGAALLSGLGLLYGGWFWMPGVAIGAVVAWGWVNQLNG
ncbi:MAG: hypothetical protein ABR529_00965 [Actinomycetota bacterium]